jgi:hypothetical protein
VAHAVEVNDDLRDRLYNWFEDCLYDLHIVNPGMRLRENPYED